MKIVSPTIYRKSQATWPSSATPDYAGEIGLVVHDGCFPYWVNSMGASRDLPDSMQEDADRLYNAARADNECPCWEKSFKAGIAVYGHLVEGHFFGRFLLDLDVANGRRKTNMDLGMCRASLMRTMLVGKMLAADYERNVWLAPSVPVMNDAQFGKLYARWHGKKSVPAQDTWNYPSVPRVSMNGALLTDTFQTWHAGRSLSMRPDPLEENEDMFL